MKLIYTKLYVVLAGTMIFFTNCNKKDNPEMLVGNWNFYYSEKFILNGKKLEEKAEGEMKFEYNGTGNVV
ncbi:MAG: hypothetical protein JNM95_11120, partial [Chitinophagaceae bacterium]|nr:hypothetical protein [Chitinophagaceae bacterium]